jgi:bacterial/archaeal transporter family-2 protein
MSSETAAFSLLMLAAGIGVPFGAAANAALGAQIGNPAAAAALLFSVGFFVCAAAALAQGAPVDFSRAQPLSMTGGAFIALYVLSVTFAAPRIGLANAVLLVLFGQMLSSAAIDHFGLMGAKTVLLNERRIFGLLLMAIGLVLARRM